MRTIGKDTDHVVLLRPADERKRAVEQIIRAFKIADGFGRRMNHCGLKRFNFEQNTICRGGNQMNLNITTADVIKFWRPSFYAIGRFYEFTVILPASASAHRTLID